VGDGAGNEGTIAMPPDSVAIVSASIRNDPTEADRNSVHWQIFKTRGDRHSSAARADLARGIRRDISQ
jgi:hypothetical protein